MLLKVRKGLVEALLLPYLTIKDKILMLPRVCTPIRNYMTQPIYERFFYNCVYINILPHVAELTVYQNLKLNKLIKVMDWQVARNLILKTLLISTIRNANVSK